MSAIENLKNVFDWKSSENQSSHGITTPVNGVVDWSSFPNGFEHWITRGTTNLTVEATGTIISSNSIKTYFETYGDSQYAEFKSWVNGLGLKSYSASVPLESRFYLPFGNVKMEIHCDHNPYNINSNSVYTNEFKHYLSGATMFTLQTSTFDFTASNYNGVSVGFIATNSVFGFALVCDNPTTKKLKVYIHEIELNDAFKTALGTEYTNGFTYEDDPNYGSGGVAQGLQGIVDTLSDDVNVPLKSTKGATTTGFINAYVIEQNELQNFGKDMFTDIDLDFEWDRTEAKQEFANEYQEIDWTETAPEVFASASSFLGTFKNFFDLIKASVQNLFTSKLINYVLSVHIIPVNPSTLEGTERINVGWKTFSQTAKRITNDYVDFDYGTLTIPSKYKNFLDYTHTHCKIFIPFTGFVDIDPRYVYDQTLGLKVRFNVLDGTCVTFLTTTGLTGNTSVIGTYSGSCCVHLPFTGENYSQIASGLLQTATSVGGALAMGNFAVGMASAMQPSMQNVAPPTQHMTKATKKNPEPIFYTTQNDINDYNNRLANAQAQYQNDLQARNNNIANAKFGRDLKTTNALMGNLGSTGNALNGSAMGSANMSSSSAFMGIRTPYIIIERPIPQLPPRYFSDHGGLANIVEKPINCSGFTRCSDVMLPTTVKSDIANKLKEIMESGFIV